jgi:hypothetical protein
MAYCTISDVRALNPKQDYTSDSTPNITHVSTFIDLIAADIDVALSSQGYATPITTPTAFVTWLKLLNALGAAAMTEDAMFPETTERGSTPHANVLRKQYDARLAKLQNGDITPETDLGDNVSSYYHVMSDQDDFPDPVFRKRSEDKDF